MKTESAATEAEALLPKAMQCHGMGVVHQDF
jgi:hypothetical protein